MTLRYKLSGLFVLAALIILIVNLYMFSISNQMTGKVEEVYVGNVSLNELVQSLDQVQASMEEYLNTKSSDAMDEYYRSEQDFRSRLGALSDEVTDNELLLMEKNIRGLSESYLSVAAETIQAKRGRNVEKYGQLFEEASRSSEEIHAFIYSLNNEQFKANSVTYQRLMQSMRYLEMVSVGVLILVLTGNASLIVISTGMITEPLNRLARAADEVARGNFDLEEMPVESRDEVGIVTGAFNQMVKSIRDYIEQLRLTMERENELKERELKMQSSLKDAQLKYLQAQVNPHFLFNTINTGTQLAMMENAPKTERFLGNTAEFFRYNVRHGQQDASLKEEIHLVDNYVYIMNVRFSGEILFTREVDETLLELRVPSMLLQPLVENAFHHGVRNIDWKGRIELSVYRRDDQACISIWDNGAGIEKERIQEILLGRADRERAPSDSNGVAMHNMIERLDLYFHGQARLEIYSEGKNKGTEILITVPVREENYVSDHAG